MTRPQRRRRPAYGMQLDHDATNRRTDLDAVDHVLGGADLLLDVVELGLRLAQLLDRLPERRRVRAGRSLFGLRDPLLRIGDAAEILAELARQARLGALQRQHLRLADQLLAKKRFLSFSSSPNRARRSFGGLHLRLISVECSPPARRSAS